jgi:leader peptidase (prepilin peptidase) / N-methyltransferase
LLFGSFLNVVGYRLIHNYNIIFKRSFCPECKNNIAWYDLVPVVSWVILYGSCRNCKQPISWLYPAIELLTASSFTALTSFVEPRYWIGYGLFFTVLLIIIRTDTQSMLISRYTTLAIIPLASILSYYHKLPITLIESIIGSLTGYFILWFIAQCFYLLRNKQGMGEGDFELLSMIGSFLGIQGVFISLFIGSIAGSCLGMYLILRGFDARTTKIAFGSWLALGAISYCLWFNNYNFI